MDIVKLYQDFSIDFRTEGHKHCRPGWVNTPCPHCTGNPGYHLGYNIANEFYVCWRCGVHRVDYTLSKLLNLNVYETRTIIQKYGSIISRSAYAEPIVSKKEHRLPSNCFPLRENHRSYLEKRNFDPDYLEKTWNLFGTGPVSFLDDTDYKHRIIIPYFWDGQQVSFDSRDITNKAESKYKACPLERELIEHKTILYGKQEVWNDIGICVEGPTDVWRFGIHSFATSGIKYTPTQLRLIAKTFKRVPVVYDDDPQAIIQANKLVFELQFRGIDSFRVPIKGDPGSMAQEEANYLVKQLLKKVK